MLDNLFGLCKRPQYSKCVQQSLLHYSNQFRAYATCSTLVSTQHQYSTPVAKLNTKLQCIHTICLATVEWQLESMSHNMARNENHSNKHSTPTPNATLNSNIQCSRLVYTTRSFETTLEGSQLPCLLDSNLHAGLHYKNLSTCNLSNTRMRSMHACRSPKIHEEIQKLVNEKGEDKFKAHQMRTSMLLLGKTNYEFVPF